MFVFTSMLIVATWFLARLLWDFVLRPAWRAEPLHARRRFAAVTATGCLVAIAGFGSAVGSIYGLIPGLVAAAALAPVYLFIAFVLRMLLRSFDVDVEDGRHP